MNPVFAAAVPACPVNSHNEWDPLEEVIIGTLDGAMFPEWNTINVVILKLVLRLFQSIL
jgi:hypothetical protein